jgi:hypothetical protein
MRKLFLLILVSFFTLFASAQQRRSKIMLITNSGDTVNGYVNSKTKLRSPSVINITDSLGRSTQPFYPASVKIAFIESGDCFVGKVVTIDKTPTNVEFGDKSDSSSMLSERDTVFLTAIVLSNNISLYNYDDDRNHFFIQNGQDTLQELIDRNYTVNVDGRIYEKEDDDYKGTLSSLFGNCPSIGNLSTLYYTFGALQNVVEKYDQSCSSGKMITYKKTQPKGKFVLAALLGATNTSIRFTSNAFTSPEPDLVTKNPVTGITSVSFGFRTQYVFQTNPERLSLLFDVYYNHYHGTEDEDARSFATTYTHKSLSLNMSFIKFDLPIRYCIPVRWKVQPFINAGGVFSSLISAHDSVTYTSPTQHDTRDPFTSGSLRNFEAGYLIGGGFNYKRFGIEYRYENTPGMTTYVYISDAFSSQNIFLSYHFN